MYGLTRATTTLLGAALAGFLLWLGIEVADDSAGGYWGPMGLFAAAGLVMALSQLLGGWTKWGWPRFSTGVFTIGFLPVLVAGGWILLARQPSDWMNTSNWSRDLGIFGAVADLGNILPAIAFGIGLVFGLSFDTSGRQGEVVEHDVRRDGTVPAASTSVRDTRAADEPLTADSDTDSVTTTTTTPGGERRIEH